MCKRNFFKKKLDTDIDLKHHLIMQRQISDELNAKFQSNEPFLDFLTLICIDGVADCLSSHHMTFEYDNIVLEIRENIYSYDDLIDFFSNLIKQAENISQKSILSPNQLQELFPKYFSST